MKLLKFKLGNYKGFRSSGWLEFSPKFTVVIGKNNSGKTALLEAFNLLGVGSHPHRSPTTPRGMPLTPNPVIEFELTLTREELHHAMLALGDQCEIPVIRHNNIVDMQQFALSLFAKQNVAVNIQVAGNEFRPLQYPSHGLFKLASDQVSIRVTAKREHPWFSVADSIVASNTDSLPKIAQVAYPDAFYVFKPERLNIGRVRASQAIKLETNASNLAAVLGTMQANHVRFDKYNEHVREIFPAIQRVSVFTVGEEFEVRLWSVAPETEREDLAIPLRESGTGVGQVLAILYVVMTVPNGVIVIDEPNSFLHPGAAKKLIQVLKRYEQHQYVLATHSAELISTARPDIIHLVSWADGESKIERIDATKLDDLRTVLTEIGVSFSDVFGYDRAVWVEGTTEEICFPIILERLLKRPALGLIFVAVRATGDFEKKRDRKKLIWDIYERLSAGALLLPAAVSFSFDREDRSEADIERLRLQSKGRACFMSRLTYENYLLDPDAIAALVNSLPREGREPATSTQVAKWLQSNGGKFISGTKWNNEIDDQQWLRKVHAPSLLNALLNELAGPGDPLDKTSHSKALTEWLIDHKPEALSELAAHVTELTDKTR
ncbi:ATP-binding protein [Bradyrhizobium sp. CCBAU 51753]|uniref:AAA family ATPase n=1 Tax=Bradyrhizobium sp. CCBAU 51753 TaxID=1325100 RepID=UPI001889C7D8|nr:ATP-binding protein [Bradyrhizobium sp. CCBAU 51753]